MNKVTVPDFYPLPLIENLLDRVGNAPFVTTIYLLKVYYQISVLETAKGILSLITPFSLYQYTVMAFGLSNAPATFQRAIKYITQNLEGTSTYLDYLLVISDSWEEHLVRLRQLMDRLQEAGLSINLVKSIFGRSSVVYLGNVVGDGTVRLKKAKVEAILAFLLRTTRKVSIDVSVRTFPPWLLP